MITTSDSSAIYIEAGFDSIAGLYRTWSSHIILDITRQYRRSQDARCTEQRPPKRLIPHYGRTRSVYILLKATGEITIFESDDFLFHVDGLDVCNFLPSSAKEIFASITATEPWMTHFSLSQSLALECSLMSCCT